MTQQQAEIVKAIEAELKASSQPRRFKVVSAAPKQNTVSIEVRSLLNGGILDHRLEGGFASWGQTISPVLAVSVDEGFIYVGRVEGGLPIPGAELTVRPPRFLESLLKCWKDDEVAAECFSWAAHALVARDRCDLPLRPSFPDLRNRQRLAYSLVSYEAGFLWGPPGTGKTTTAASLVADLVLADGGKRVLLLAPTNSAVDQLLLAVDDRLSLSPKGQQLRTECARLGNNFLARYYQNRRHLLPQASDELVLKKAQLEATQPSADDIQTRVQWQREMSRVLSELRSEVDLVLAQKKVVAMTTTLAAMHYAALKEHSPFDLVVFDEASQIGRAVSFMFAPLGRRALVAGDPNQLAPIVTSTVPFVRKWFGRTLFDEYMHPKHPSTCFLNEQSRMAAPICGIVSDLFYYGELKVSEDCSGDQVWHNWRRPVSLFPAGRSNNVHLIDVDAESVPHGKSHHRPESADAVAATVQQLIADVNPAQILVLTPFVAQRKLIRASLNARGLRKVRVSTVHAAQGAEIHTVIFDPVNANSRFLTDPQNGARLLNVAISRAQACFILLASVGDLRHPLLFAIAKRIRPNEHCSQASSGS